MLQSSGRLVASRCHRSSAGSLVITSQQCRLLHTGGLRRLSDHDHGDTKTQDVPREGLSIQQLRRQLELYSPLDVYRRTFLRIKATNRALQINANVKKNNFSPKRDAQPSPYQRKRLVSHRPMNLAMDLFREQLVACSNPQDVVRIMTTAFKDDQTAETFASEHVQYRALAKLRLGKNPGLVLEALSALHRRFQEKGFELHVDFALLGLEAAAKTLHHTALRHWLDVVGSRSSDKYPIARHSSFRQILRNLSKAVSQAHHVDYETLRAFLFSGEEVSVPGGSSALREYLHIHILSSFAPYIDILVSLEEREKVVQEWNLCLENKTDSSVPSICLVFIKAFFKLSMPHEAWNILSKFGHQAGLDEIAWSLILKNLDTMPELDTSLVKEHEGSLVNMLQTKLEELEHDLGLKWVRDEESPDESRHVMLQAGREIDEHEDWLEALVSSSEESSGSAENDGPLPSYSEDPHWREYLERQNAKEMSDG